MKSMAFVLALAVVVCAAGVGMGQQVTMDSTPSITVSGDAVVYATPDKIVISLGIETMDKDMMVAKQKNNDIMKKAITALKGTGVQEKDIQTDQLSIEPRWRDNYDQQAFLGYFVRNTMALTVTDPARVEAAITAALQAGVTHIHGVDFQTSALKELRDQARELALKAAQEKAEKMAGALDQEVDVPVVITEESGGYHPLMNRWGGMAGGFGQNVAVDTRGDVGEAGETIALGKIAVRASVRVTFTLVE